MAILGIGILINYRIEPIAFVWCLGCGRSYEVEMGGSGLGINLNSVFLVVKPSKIILLIQNSIPKRSI